MPVHNPDVRSGGSVVFDGGYSFADKKNEGVVDFTSVFSTIPFVALTPHSKCNVWLFEVTLIGFTWMTDSKKEVMVDWIVVS